MSIRAILFVQVAIALCVFCVAYTGREQRRIVMAIDAAGGDVHRDEPYKDFYGPDPRDVWWRRWTRAYAGDDFLCNVHTVVITNERDLSSFPWSELSGLPYLVSIEVACPTFSNDDLRKLCRLKRIASVFLGETSVTDTGLSSLRELENLVDLWLCENPRVTHEAFDQISQLGELRNLSLTGFQRNSQGFGKLSQCRKLVDLYSDAAPSIEEISEFVGHPALTQVSIAQDKVSPEVLSLIEKHWPFKVVFMCGFEATVPPSK